MRRFAPALALAAAAAALILWLAPGAGAQQGRGDRYEYAELQLSGNDALVILSDRAVFLEGPRERDRVKVQNNTKIEVIIPNQVTYLTRLGDEGWELVPRCSMCSRKWLMPFFAALS